LYVVNCNITIHQFIYDITNLSDVLGKLRELTYGLALEFREKSMKKRADIRYYTRLKACEVLVERKRRM